MKGGMFGVSTVSGSREALIDTYLLRNPVALAMLLALPAAQFHPTMKLGAGDLLIGLGAAWPVFDASAGALDVSDDAESGWSASPQKKVC
jgi:hypothetical protein